MVYACYSWFVDLISTAGEAMILPAIPDIINEFNITFLIHLEY